MAENIIDVNHASIRFNLGNIKVDNLKEFTIRKIRHESRKHPSPVYLALVEKRVIPPLVLLEAPVLRCIVQYPHIIKLIAPDHSVLHVNVPYPVPELGSRMVHIDHLPDKVRGIVA